MEDTVRPGRPPAMANEEKKMALQELVDTESSTAAIANEYFVSGSSIYKYAKADGLSFGNPILIPTLTDKQKQDRAEFCKELQGLNWEYIIIYFAL